MKIKYLFHSGFIVETDDVFLVFDYFKDNCKKPLHSECGQLCPSDIPKDKKVIFFVSHAHYDHFDKEIFNLCDNAKFVISNDLRINKTDNIIVCKPYEKFEVEGMEIKTFGSTDEGLSYLVKIEDKVIFHAGDLNWWHWEGETDTNKSIAKFNFESELDKIKGEKIDIAMFPVDPRLEGAYYFGGKAFIEAIKPDVFIPMHFQDLYSVTDKFKKLIDDNYPNVRVITLLRRGQYIDL